MNRKKKKKKVLPYQPIATFATFANSGFSWTKSRRVGNWAMQFHYLVTSLYSSPHSLLTYSLGCLLHPHFFCFIPTFCYIPQTNHVPSKLYLVTNWTPKKIIYEISFLYILLVIICVSKRFSWPFFETWVLHKRWVSLWVFMVGDALTLQC
jgi:hypothetical protein